MKKIIKIIAVISVFIPMLANAYVSNKDIKNILDGDEKTLNEWKMKSLKGDYSKFIIALQKEKIKDKERLRNAESVAIDLISINYKMNNNWSIADIDYPNPVMIDNSIVDLNRVSIGSVDFETIKVNNHYLINERSETWHVNDTFLSKTLMRQGYPAIGPDGKEIQLCRLFNNKNATFYEISSSTVKTFIEASHSKMTVNEACIQYPGALKSYWEKRYELSTGKSVY